MIFGCICSPVPGHLNPICTIARTLISRGHRVIIFTLIDSAALVERSGVEYEIIGKDAFPAGSFQKLWGPLAGRDGLDVMMQTLKIHTRFARSCCDEIPQFIKSRGIQALLIDQIQFQGEAIARIAGIPFITVACALHLNQAKDPIPTPTVSWQPPTSLAGKLRARFAWWIFNTLTSPVLREGNRLLRKNSLSPLKSLAESYSSRGQIIPMVKEFDWPSLQKSSLPLFYVGSLMDSRPGDLPFVPKIDSRPLIFLSLGTLQNKHLRLLSILKEALAGQNVIFAQGNWQGEQTPLETWCAVLPYAPQLEILQHADLCITHGGCNTVNESLACGVPLLVLPITHDQPALGARVQASKAGISLLSTEISVESVRHAVDVLLTEKSYKERASYFAKLHKEAGGAEQAVTHIEQLCQTEEFTQ